MKILEVLIEYKIHSLDRPFSYLYYGNKKVDKGYRVLIEFNNRTIVGFVLDVKETLETKEELEERLGFELLPIYDVLDDTPLLNDELLELADRIKEYYIAPKISVLQTMLPTSLSPKHTALKGPKIAYDFYVTVIDGSEDGLTIKQIELLRQLKPNGRVLKRDIKSKSILEKLIELNKVKIEKEEKRRLKIPHFEYQKPYQLTPDQEAVKNEFISSKDKIYLLEGITGSGKTEIYLNLIEKYLSENKGVIFLVPEISLTPMMMEYLIRRFNYQVAILHSELTSAEKYDEYRKIAKGECKVVIGARSAVFAPVNNLGLIILDEEHTETYKQDNVPFYHARDVAIMRSEISGCKVLMGTATPSLETEARAIKGIYHHLKLTKRINKMELPKTEIVNMLDVRNINRDSYMFSKPLRSAIRYTIDKGEQVILLLNRRGFSTNVVCRNCGALIKCPNCGIALTYHKTDNLMKCHHCDHVEEYPTICPECGGTHFMRTGFGSEKVEEEVNRLFPDAKTIRIDSDSTMSRNKIPSLIEKFRKHEANILIGTQMVAKGHDFPGVSLVGIVLADIGLGMPSYRSSERVFQLITQAIGRCGRGDIPGRAIIQTYMPRCYSILLGAKQNYKDFYITEMQNRKIQGYPPFYYLASISLTSNSKDNLSSYSEIAVSILKSELKETKAIVIGPITPYISYKNGTYEKQVLIKYKNKEETNKILKDFVDIFKNKSGLSISINIDPYNF